MNDYIAVIPARSGSKSIIDKNLQMVGPKSLIEWAISVALETKEISRVICSTDSTEYANAAKKYGAEVPYLRPKNLAADNSTDFDVFQNLISTLELGQDTILVHLRPTTPLRSSEKVSEAITLYGKLSGKVHSLRSVHEMSESAYKTFDISDNQTLSPLSRHLAILDANLPRQKFPTTYVANGYVDVFPSKNLLTFGNLHGELIHPFTTPSVLEVDSKNDLELLRMHYEYREQAMRKEG